MLHTPLSGRRRAQLNRPEPVTIKLTNEQTTVVFNEPVVCLSRCFTPTSVVAGIPTDKLAADCASIKQIKTTIDEIPQGKRGGIGYNIQSDANARARAAYVTEVAVATFCGVVISSCINTMCGQRRM